MNALFLDPSFRATGFAVYCTETKTVIHWGVIQTMMRKDLSETESDTKRVEHIIKTLLKIIKDHKVELIVSETVVGSKSSAAAKALHQCKGAIVSMALCLKIPLTLVKATDVKLKASGTRTAQKDEIVQYATDRFPEVRDWLNSNPKYAKEAVSDSLAILGYWIDSSS